jgi:hypothetical protein
VPDTWLIPHRVPPDNPRFVPMAERYNPPFDLDAIAERIGYPLFMKPFDGSTWTAVTRIASSGELHQSYEESGERLMHLQAAVEGYDVFTRSLSIGPQTRVMHYDVTQEHHYRYTPDRDFLSPALDHEVTTISRLVNAFFRWDFNSCEAIVKDGQAYPIDFANASPDLALTSLSYHFPWAIKSLIAWCLFCTVTGRSMPINQSTRDYFDVGDREDLTYEEKLECYRELADAHLQAAAFAEFRDAALPHLDEMMVEYIESAEFDELLVQVIRTEEQPNMQESLIERSRVLVGAGAADEHVAVR